VGKIIDASKVGETHLTLHDPSQPGDGAGNKMPWNGGSLQNITHHKIQGGSSRLLHNEKENRRRNTFRRAQHSPGAPEHSQAVGFIQRTSFKGKSGVVRRQAKRTPSRKCIPREKEEKRGGKTLPCSRRKNRQFKVMNETEKRPGRMGKPPEGAIHTREGGKTLRKSLNLNPNHRGRRHRRITTRPPEMRESDA